MTTTSNVAGYAEWLEQRHLLDVRPPLPTITEQARRRRETARPVRLLAAAAATIALVAGGVALARRPPSPSVASQRQPTTVLYRAMIGGGDDQLSDGFCDTCEPEAYAPPLLLDNGDVVIPDVANRRWVLVHDGVPRVVAFGAWELAGIAMTDGVNVFAPVRDPDDVLTILKFTPPDLTTPVQGAVADNPNFVVAVGGQVVDRGVVVPGLTSDTPTPGVTATPGTDGRGQTLLVTTADRARGWRFPETWSVRPPDENSVRPLDDGTILLVATLPTNERLLLDLAPDGVARAVPVPESLINASASEAGLVGFRATGNDVEVVLVPRPSTLGAPPLTEVASSETG